MNQEYARVSVESPEIENKSPRSHMLTYEVENSDIQDEFTVKF